MHFKVILRSCVVPSQSEQPKQFVVWIMSYVPRPHDLCFCRMLQSKEICTIRVCTSYPRCVIILKAWLKDRSGMTANEARDRMARQWAPERIEKQADQLLFNDGQRALVPQILQAMDSLH